MTHQAAHSYTACEEDPGEQVAQLRHMLVLVERVTGRDSAEREGERLDEAARISSAYASALPVVQRRFDALAAETANWATAGIDVLLALQARKRETGPAATRLAQALTKALRKLGEIIPA